jgi:SAM-dependent methyltransferase
MPEPAQETTRACPLCGRDSRGQPALRFAPPPWRLRACAQCGFVYLENPPAVAVLEDELAWEKGYAAEHERRRRQDPLYRAGRAGDFLRHRVLKRNKFLALARRYFPARGKFLDVGCGDGRLLAALPEGSEPWGIEVSRGLAALAGERFRARGGRVLQAPALQGMEQLEAASFDGAAMISYLEHEPEPRPALAACARLLKPGACLILKTPNFASVNRRLRGARWCGFRWPEHVNYFTPASLRHAVENAGLQVKRFGPLDRLPTSDNMWLVVQQTRTA